MPREALMDQIFEILEILDIEYVSGCLQLSAAGSLLAHWEVFLKGKDILGLVLFS